MINKSKRALEGILTKTTAFLGLTAAAMTTYEKLVLSTDKPFELYSPALLLGIGIPLAVAYKGTKHLAPITKKISNTLTKAGTLCTLSILAALSYAPNLSQYPLRLTSFITDSTKISLEEALIRDSVREMGIREGFPYGLTEAIAEVESGFDPCAVSRLGAVGIMQLMPGATPEAAKTYWNARNFTGDETQGTELKEQLKKEGCKRAKERDDRFDTQKNIAWAGELLKKHKGYVQNLLRRQESYPVADIFQRLIVSYRDGPKAAAEKKYGPNNYYQKVCDAAGTPTCTSWKITSILEYLKEQTKRIRKR